MQPSCDRLRIGLRPCATCHKFRLFTGFAAGRPPEHPPGRPLRYRIQAMEMSADRKKNTRPVSLCVGDALKAFLARQVPTGGAVGSKIKKIQIFLFF